MLKYDDRLLSSFPILGSLFFFFLFRKVLKILENVFQNEMWNKILKVQDINFKVDCIEFKHTKK